MYFLFWLYDVFLFGFDVFIFMGCICSGENIMLCVLFCFLLLFLVSHIWYI